MAARATGSPGLKGIIGILSEGDAREERYLEHCIGKGLGGIEVRADLLLLKPGWDRHRLLGRVRAFAERGVPVLFTPRVGSQGGRFPGSEDERVKLCQHALAAGACAVDVEWGTAAERALTDAGAPLVLSAHDFEGMPSATTLDALTREMTSRRPFAVKIVPTASGLRDSVRMLEWVSGAADGVARIGFAMGAGGVPSRILAISRGSPYTYGCLGPGVASGVLPALELLEVYAAHRLTAGARLFGVVGDKALGSFSPYLHNPAFGARGIDAVYVPFQVDSFKEIADVADELDVDGLSVTIPFKEDARRFSDRLDDRSLASGATNTVVIRGRPGIGAGRAAHGYNTDFDGVLDPLGRRLKSLRGIAAAVLGNGGAARGAVLALKEAGASPVLYYRNPERGDPVARALGVAGKSLGALESDRPRILINATPLGRDAGDPSPVPPACLRALSGEPPRIAFDMVYEPAETEFLAAARSAGAVLVPGREMLVAQGAHQFRHFTNSPATAEEFDENYARGMAIRERMAG